MNAASTGSNRNRWAMLWWRCVKSQHSTVPRAQAKSSLSSKRSQRIIISHQKELILYRIGQFSGLTGPHHHFRCLALSTKPASRDKPIPMHNKTVSSTSLVGLEGDELVAGNQDLCQSVEVSFFVPIDQDLPRLAWLLRRAHVSINACNDWRIWNGRSISPSKKIFPRQNDSRGSSTWICHD